MLSAMQEDDGLIWAIYGTMPYRRRMRLLRTLRRQYAADLTDAEALVAALRHRLLLVYNTLSDYMHSDKHGDVDA